LGSNYTSLSVVGDLRLNPQPITIGGTAYPANSVAIVLDQATVRNTDLSPTSQQVQGQYSKIAYAYDLRQIGSAAAPGSRDHNGNGTVDWNDAFVPLLTMGELQAAQGVSSTTTPNIARSFAFSSSGQSIYFNDAAANFGGIWKKDLTGAAALTKIVDARNAERINTEPAVVASTVRDFGGGAGDQVIVQGGADIGNTGGLSFVVDNGATVSAPQAILTQKQLAGFFDFTGASPDIRGVSADSAGNLYLVNSANPTGAFLYDTEGRLAKIFSNAEQRVFERANGATGHTTSIFDSKVREATVNLPGGGTAVLPQVLFSDSSVGLRAPVAATAFKVGDFNRDNVVDTADVALFKGALGLRGQIVASIGSSSPFTQVDTHKLKFDLNGSMLGGGIAGVAIDWKDVKIFQQFAGLSDGDVDMDFDVDANDLNTLAAHYNGGGKLFTQGNLTSVRIDNADRDDVNYADLVTLAANWTAAKPALGGIGSIPQADLDRAFAITAGGAISQYQGAGGADTWSNAAGWSGAGVPNAPGAVASLLTKPQNDVALNVDGNYTVGQLNFDNYFSYALTGGGTLTLQGSNGTAAEINTFAASPSIVAGVAVASDTNLTVTYAADTLALSGAVSSSAGVTINKLGAGTLAIGGPQAHGAGAILNANAGMTDFDSDGGANLNVNVAAAVRFNVSQTLAAVSISPGGVATLTANGTHILRTPSLAVSGKLDLTDNKLIVDSGALGTWNGTTYTGITGLIDSGRGSASDAKWDGLGIVTTDARAIETGNRAAIGIARAGDLGRNTFAVQDVDADDVVAMLTWGGDATLDGKVNIDDYGRIDANVASSGSVFGWFNGDFNYDGSINIDDYGIIDGNISQQDAPFPTASGSGAAAGMAAVPEPAGTAAAALMLLAGGRRRRRRRYMQR
jgi:hypothetical protein